jgi:hypothetical protein
MTPQIHLTFREFSCHRKQELAIHNFSLLKVMPSSWPKKFTYVLTNFISLYLQFMQTCLPLPAPSLSFIDVTNPSQIFSFRFSYVTLNALIFKLISQFFLPMILNFSFSSQYFIVKKHIIQVLKEFFKAQLDTRSSHGLKHWMVPTFIT